MLDWGTFRVKSAFLLFSLMHLLVSSYMPTPPPHLGAAAHSHLFAKPTEGCSWLVFGIVACVENPLYCTCFSQSQWFCQPVRLDRTLDFIKDSTHVQMQACMGLAHAHSVHAARAHNTHGPRHTPECSYAHAFPISSERLHQHFRFVFIPRFPSMQIKRVWSFHQG